MGEETTTIEEMKAKTELDALKAEVQYLKGIVDRQCDEKEVARLRGIIEGLKFALRVNGISGGDVR